MANAKGRGSYVTGGVNESMALRGVSAADADAPRIDGCTAELDAGTFGHLRGPGSEYWQRSMCLP